MYYRRNVNVKCTELTHEGPVVQINLFIYYLFIVDTEFFLLPIIYNIPSADNFQVEGDIAASGVWRDVWFHVNTQSLQIPQLGSDQLVRKINLFAYVKYIYGSCRGRRGLGIIL